MGEQAGAVAVGEHAVFAGAQLEHFLQNFYAVAHGVAIGIGPEVLIGLFQAAAIVGKLRVFVPANHEIGIGFVVAKQNVVFGRERFNQVVFQNQRFGKRDFYARHLFEHQHDARRVVVFLEIAGHAAFEIDRLADV